MACHGGWRAHLRDGVKQRRKENWQQSERKAAMAASGIWNLHAAPGQALASAKAAPMTGPASGSGSTSSTATSSSDSATISANDFLTLLVTEMQNQDPTADTDPNEYINQLVNVNSLEQLISINQNLTTALGESSSSTSGTTSDATSASRADKTAVAPDSGAARQSGVVNGLQSVAGTKLAPGNLGIPDAKPSAQRVASALDGRTRAPSRTAGN